MKKDFFGHKETKIHDKRINIPKEFKSKFEEAEELIVTIGPKKRIAIFTKTNFEETVNILKSGNRIQKKLSQYIRSFAMSSQTLEGPGRVRIDPDLLKLTEIGKEVMIEGNGNYLSIWDAEIYDQHRKQLFSNHFDEIVEDDYDI